MRLTYATLLFSLAATLFSLRPAAAQTSIIGFTSNAYGVEDNAKNALGSSTGSFTLGFEFTANSAALVTSLGYFDDPSFNPSAPFNTVALNPAPTGSYTFSQSHQVGLYQIVGGVSHLLTSTTITASGTPHGDFLYQTINPIALVAGGDYVLAGVTGPNDPYLFDVQDSTQFGNIGVTTTGITYGEALYDPGSTLARPTQTDPNAEPGFFGPNLQITFSAPEPSQGAALGLTALGLGGLLWRARRRAA